MRVHRPEDDADAPPVWAAFGDLMACLFGIFVLFFCWMVLMEVSLTEDLHQVRAEREAAAARLDALERALAGPLASGLITLTDGRIGIRGSVLFDRGSAELTPEGQGLLNDLAEPLQSYLTRRGEAVMVSGFTDDLALRPGGTFVDNWELSAERALTVTRTLVAAGMPGQSVFAAGFGSHHPVAANDSVEGRALNRRVEIAPVPQPLLRQLTASGAAPEPTEERDADGDSPAESDAEARSPEVDGDSGESPVDEAELPAEELP